MRISNLFAKYATGGDMSSTRSNRAKIQGGEVVREVFETSNHGKLVYI